MPNRHTAPAPADVGIATTMHELAGGVCVDRVVVSDLDGVTVGYAITAPGEPLTRQELAALARDLEHLLGGAL